ncbi:NfeD-like C-terminal, partner-binding [Actinomyces bovis]|uniref:NfeD-like C-terminal, partner-binding n=1 Tax=Actinomyces bovis TaxID=1658 RepID=A0ABY1VQL2_9ACTO|nr:nodulation protein NfeD [Actinomyces bovis]SPT54424.1 NfeD-like C-terminal, partner-binding [Actinomyces bovis]VEG55989.1 NfeD-like C-terminal, partner-binding [Actinomyces israelii]
MTLFSWCCVIGCGVLLLSLVLDGLFDGFLDGLDDSFFDGALPVTAMAVGVFGAMGMLVQALLGREVNAAVAFGVPLTAGLASGWATRSLWRRFKRSMPRNAVAPMAEELVGARVRVQWWREGRGEVSASARGHQLTLLAISDEALHAGAEVIVLDAKDGVLQVTAL